MEASAKSNLKKVSWWLFFHPVFIKDQVSLELGGKSPSLVFESADLEQGQNLYLNSSHPAYVDAAAAWGLMGGLYNSGQDCTCGSRIYVQSTVYDKFLSIMKEKVKEYHIGDGFDSKSTAGPLV